VGRARLAKRALGFRHEIFQTGGERSTMWPMRVELRTLGFSSVLVSSVILGGCVTEPAGDGGTFGTFTTTGDGDGDPSETGNGDGDGDGDGDPGDGDGEPNPNCGDSIVDPGEECDLGPENADAGLCTTACRIAACGDGFVYEGFEECDDGNPNNGCTVTCLPGVCGDGIVQAGEQCDDDNDITSDACPACQLAFCGDGYMQAGVESCDDGNMSSNDACTNPFCEPAVCGDGIVWEGMEECDDGNMDDNDGCPACFPGSCGDGFKWDGMEECDDGNNVSDDGCDAACMSECGGFVLAEDWNGWTYYKVPVMGFMTDPNIAQACADCGLEVPCQGLNGCAYNDNICVQTNNENSCGNPMLALSQMLCNAYPSSCQQLWGVYQYMGNNWSGGCGAEQNGWCAQGNNMQNKFALCVSN
jgi:cysteine-rich repeat protein